jgi:hypothetical protein
MDISIARAIIKRAMTDNDIWLSRNWPNSDAQNLYKKNGKELSLLAAYKKIKHQIELFFAGSLIKIYRKKHKLFRNEEIAYIYVDVETAAFLRGNHNVKYPKEFWVKACYIASKRKWANIDHDYAIFKISTHCIERLIQRSNAQCFHDAIRLLSPIIDYVLKFSDMLLDDYRAYIIKSQEFLVYWSGGYIVLRRETNSVPIVITWIPREYFTQNQHAKFINFQERINESPNKPIIFDSTIARSKIVLKTEDELQIFNNEWDINEDHILWEKIRKGD